MSDFIQQSFCPIDYGFYWVGDWYEFDPQPATLAAKDARKARVSELKQAGYTIKQTSDKQLITRGGIGTNHPQIEELVTVFYITAWR